MVYRYVTKKKEKKRDEEVALLCSSAEFFAAFAQLKIQTSNMNEEPNR